MPRSSSHFAPSGRQFVVGHGHAQAVVTEVGATLRSYSIAGEAVVDGFAENEMSTSGRGQVLAPWPNRLGDGRYRFGERSGRAAWDEPDHHNAIHGLVRFVPWQLQSQAQNVVVLACVLHPQPGYPWRLRLQVEYRLGRGGLTVFAEATNLDEVPAPFGIGFHPYLTVGTPTVDTTRLRLRAGSILRTDDRGLPVVSVPLAGSEFDFSVARPVGPTRLDTCYQDLERDLEGRARVELRHPDSGRTVAMWMDRAFGYLMAYSGDSVANERRRHALALEPMSCPPDAFRSGTALIALDPGSTWSGTWGISID